MIGDMSYLTYISDEELTCIVKGVLDVAIERKKKAKAKFNKNVIDPFGSLFESAAFDVDHTTWKESEMIRQCQKTLQNHIGDLHQKILGHVVGWGDLGTGSVVDLINKDKQIIAEVKNKYSTVTGGKLADQYYSLERLVMPKASSYKGYTAYFVNIIPKKPELYDKAFEPSDKDKGSKCPKNEQIRIIDGNSFYALVTEQKNALEELYKVLPKVIEDIFENSYGKKGFKVKDKSKFAEYFDLAYKK